MPDYSTFAAVDALVRRIEPEAWSGYRANCAKAERFFRGLHRQDLISLLRTNYPYMYERGELRPDLTPFARRIVERATGLWSKRPDRIYLLGERPLPEESPLVRALQSSEDARSQALQDMDRYSYLCRSALLRVEWNDRAGRLCYWPVNPADAWVIRSTSSDDIQDVDAVIYRLNNVGDQQRFCLWSREIQCVYRGNGVDQIHSVEEQPDYKNPLGLLPFVVAREESARGKFFPAYMEDLVDAAEVLSKAESAQTANIEFNSFGQPVVPSDTKLRRPIGRGAALEEPHDDKGLTRYLDKHTPFGEIAQELQRKLRVFALTRGLSPNDFSFEGSTPESGFAKLIDSLPRLEMRDARIQSVGLPVEQQLVQVEVAVLSYHTRSSLPKVGVETHFPPVEFPRSEEEKARADLARRQAQRESIALHLTNPIRILIEEAGLSPEDAASQVLENLTVNSRIAATMPILPALPAR